MSDTPETQAPAPTAPAAAPAKPKKEGVAWKKVNSASINGNSKKLLATYETAYKSAQEAGDALRTSLNKEHRNYSFNVINGKVLCAPAAKKAKDKDTGGIDLD